MENLIDGQGDLDVKAFGLSLIKWAYAGFSELGFVSLLLLLLFFYSFSFSFSFLVFCFVFL